MTEAEKREPARGRVSEPVLPEVVKVEKMRRKRIGRTLLRDPVPRHHALLAPENRRAPFPQLLHRCSRPAEVAVQDDPRLLLLLELALRACDGVSSFDIVSSCDRGDRARAASLRDVDALAADRAHRCRRRRSSARRGRSRRMHDLYRRRRLVDDAEGAWRCARCRGRKLRAAEPEPLNEAGPDGDGRCGFLRARARRVRRVGRVRDGAGRGRGGGGGGRGGPERDAKGGA